MKVHNFTPQDGIQARAHRKENNFQQQLTLVAVYKRELVEIAQLRIYGTKAANYACLWVNDRKTQMYCSGSGKASGYGYHRPSEAVRDAFNSAGIYLNQDISGRGEQAINEALTALGKKLGYRKTNIIEAHG